MPNHNHLEPDTDGPRLCGMMRDLDGNYARSFNEDAVGVAHVSRYIHLNPVGLEESPFRYRWSSCGSYLGLTEAPPWLDRTPVTTILRNEDLSDLENYRRYLQEGLELPRRPRKADPLSDFHEEWMRFLEERCIERLAGKESLLGRISLRSLVCYVAHRIHRMPAQRVAEYFGVSAATVRNVGTRVHERAAKDPLLAEAIRSATNSATQIW